MTRTLARAHARGLLLAPVLALLLLVGCASDGARHSTDVAQDTPASTVEAGGHISRAVGGTPWGAWLVLGTEPAAAGLTVRDDFYESVVAPWQVEHERDAAVWDGWSVTDEREREIERQMIDLLESSEASDAGVGALRRIFELSLDWDARDEAGLSPLQPIVERIEEIGELDDLCRWLGSDDYRLAATWLADADGEAVAPTLVCLSPWVLEEGDGFGVELLAGEPLFADAVLTDVFDASVSETDFELALTALGNARLARDVLVRLGYAEEDAERIVDEARSFELEVFGDADDGPSRWWEGELAKLDEVAGGFPTADLIGSWGLGGASVVEVDDTQWLRRLGAAWREDNVPAIRSWCLAWLVVTAAPYLDGETYDAWYYSASDAADELAEQGVARAEDEEWADEPELTDAEYDELDRIGAVSDARDLLPSVHARVWCDAFLDDRMVEEATEVAEAVRDAVAEAVDEADWVSAPTRQALKERLRTCELRIGSPEVWPAPDEGALRAVAEAPTLFEAARSAGAVELDLAVRALVDPDATQWSCDAVDVNAYYEPTENACYLPAGYVGGAYWGADGTYEERLAGIGSALGHELAHALEPALAAGAGERDVWGAEDRVAYEERRAQVAEAISRIDPLGEGAYEGDLFADEIAADLLGLQAALRVAGERDVFDMDAFFKAYARTWAAVWPLTECRLFVEQGTHPLDNLRVNLPLAWTDEFYATYPEVSEGDAMYVAPEARVRIW